MDNNKYVADIIAKTFEENGIEFSREVDARERIEWIKVKVSEAFDSNFCADFKINQNKNRIVEVCFPEPLVSISRGKRSFDMESRVEMALDTDTMDDIIPRYAQVTADDMDWPDFYFDGDIHSDIINDVFFNFECLSGIKMSYDISHKVKKSTTEDMGKVALEVLNEITSITNKVQELFNKALYTDEVFNAEAVRSYSLDRIKAYLLKERQGRTEKRRENLDDYKIYKIWYDYFEELFEKNEAPRSPQKKPSRTDKTQLTSEFLHGDKSKGIYDFSYMPFAVLRRFPVI